MTWILANVSNQLHYMYRDFLLSSSQQMIILLHTHVSCLMIMQPCAEFSSPQAIEIDHRKNKDTSFSEAVMILFVNGETNAFWARLSQMCVKRSQAWGSSLPPYLNIQSLSRLLDKTTLCFELNFLVLRTIYIFKRCMSLSNGVYLQLDVNLLEECHGELNSKGRI